MSAGLRDQYLEVYQPVAGEADGVPLRRYVLRTACWGRIDVPGGIETTQGAGAEHRQRGACLVSRAITIGRGDVIRDPDGILWEVRAKSERRRSYEWQLELECNQQAQGTYDLLGGAVS